MEKNSTLFSFSSSENQTKDLSGNHPNISGDSAVPGGHVIQNILNYSKALRIEKSKAVGSVEVILN